MQNNHILIKYTSAFEKRKLFVILKSYRFSFLVNLVSDL